MKKLWLFVLASALAAGAQTTTTVTGTIKDLTQSVVNSGKVTFTLQPSRDTTISGLARFSPQQVVCLINASGLIKAQDGVSTCTVTMNTALQPPGSYYRVDVWPGNVKTSSFTFYAVLATYDWSTVVPTPATSPAQNFVDVFSNQTIGGNKIWTGTQLFNGPVSFPGGVNGPLIASIFSSATVNPAQSGVFRLAAGDTACWRNQANSADVCISKNGSDQLALTNPLLVPNLIDNALPPTSPVCTDVNKQLTGACAVTSVTRGFSVAGGGSDVAAGSTAMGLVLDPNTAGATYSYVSPTATDIGEGQVTSSATAGKGAFFAASANVVGFGTFQSFIAHAKLVTTANVRVWIGITDATFPAGLQADAPLQHQAMFRYSTSAGDSNWQCYASNGVAATIVNSGVAIDANPHQFAVALAGGTLTYSIDGTARCSINTNVPAGANNGTPALSVDNIGLGNAVSLDGSYFFWTNTQ